VRQQLQRDARASKLFASRSTADRDAFLSGPSSELPTKTLDFVVKSDVQVSHTPASPEPIPYPHGTRTHPLRAGVCGGALLVARVD